jgi:hypothetical protein
VQPVRFAEGAAGFAGVANERGDCIAAREYAADDLAADAAGRWRRSLRWSPCLLSVKLECITHGAVAAQVPIPGQRLGTDA